MMGDKGGPRCPTPPHNWPKPKKGPSGPSLGV